DRRYSFPSGGALSAVRAAGSQVTDSSAEDEPLDEELVTVVVPARNEERFIGDCLESLIHQDYRNLQIIVVDSASTDRTRDIALLHARRDSRITILSQPQPSIPRSLNAALAEARGRWFVRVDAHCKVELDYVGALVRHLRT